MISVLIFGFLFWSSICYPTPTHTQANPHWPIKLRGLLCWCCVGNRATVQCSCDCFEAQLVVWYSTAVNWIVMVICLIKVNNCVVVYFALYCVGSVDIAGLMGLIIALPDSLHRPLPPQLYSVSTPPIWSLYIHFQSATGFWLRQLRNVRQSFSSYPDLSI